MRVLLLGASSMLGAYMIQSLPENVSLLGTYYNNTALRYLGELSTIEIVRMDIKDAYQVRRVFKVVQPDVVIHSASIGSVDYCREHKDLATRVNVEGTKYVCEMCKLHNARLIYLSTNAVFDGRSAPYTEKRVRNPINHYGHTKRIAESYVQRCLPETKRLIVRPMLLYGWPWEGGRGNWATKAVESLEKGESLRVVDDRWYQPTYTADLARVIWQMVDDRMWGTVHIAGPDKMTLYHFVRHVCSIWGEAEHDVEPITSNLLEGIAPRPVDTTYNLDKATAMSYTVRGVIAGLKAMRKEKEI